MSVLECICGSALSCIFNTAWYIATSDEREQAKSADNYIQKWILTDGTIITVFQCPAKWLRLTIQNCDKVEKTVPLLEPQKQSQLIQTAIEKVISCYPYVIRENRDIDINFLPRPAPLQNSAKHVYAWDLSREQVLGFKFSGSFLRSNGNPLGPGHLSLVRNLGELQWEFFAEKSRILSLQKALTNTWVPIGNEWEPIGKVDKLWSVINFRWNDSKEDRFLKILNLCTVQQVDVSSELDHTEAAKRGYYCTDFFGVRHPLIWRAKSIEDVYLSYIQYPSKIDPEQTISLEKWSVTLIFIPVTSKIVSYPHAEILFEKITVDGHVFQIAHLTARCGEGVYSYYNKQADNRRVTEDCAFENLKKWKRQSETWIRSADKVNEVIDSIRSRANQPLSFCITGDGSLLSRVMGGSGHNCMSWAKCELRALDIELPDHITDNFWVHPHQYAK